MAKPKKGAGGRPSKYDSEYCERLLRHMEQGLSVEAFAGVIGVSRDTLYEWVKVHPEFSDTIKRGADVSLLFWERIGLTGMAGKIHGFNAAVYIFNMKNRFKWRDVYPIDDQSKDQVANKSSIDDAIAELELEQKIKSKKQKVV